MRIGAYPAVPGLCDKSGRAFTMAEMVISCFVVGLIGLTMASAISADLRVADVAAAFSSAVRTVATAR